MPPGPFGCGKQRAAPAQSQAARLRTRRAAGSTATARAPSGSGSRRSTTGWWRSAARCLACARPSIAHASVHGDTVRFHYRGKAGKEQVNELWDRRVARIVRELKKVPGKDLFQHVAEDGSVVNVRRRHINDYIKGVMGEHFSAKDFRTWAGRLIAACALARLEGEEVEGRSDRRKMIVAAVKETAAQLGNTPAVCKSSYTSG